MAGKRPALAGSEGTAQPSQPMCKFGKYSLPILGEHDRRRFDPLRKYPIDEQQQCLLDGIWAARGSQEKLNACNALQFYFSKIIQKPIGKNFAYYVLYTSKAKGIYTRYATLCSAIEGRPKGADTWKGFYSFAEAQASYFDVCGPELSYVEEEEPALELIQERTLNLDLHEQVHKLTELVRIRELQLEQLSDEAFNLIDITGPSAARINKIIGKPIPEDLESILEAALYDDSQAPTEEAREYPDTSSE